MSVAGPHPRGASEDLPEPLAPTMQDEGNKPFAVLVHGAAEGDRIVFFVRAPQKIGACFKHRKTSRLR